jgi:hypothetical protein
MPVYSMKFYLIPHAIPQKLLLKSLQSLSHTHRNGGQ